MKQKQFITLCSFLIVILASCATVSNTSAVKTKNSTEEAKNIASVRTYWDEVWNKGNLQAVADFYHPNAIHGDDFTIEDFQKGVKWQRDAVPDFKVAVHDMFATGEKVISEVTYTGTHTGIRFLDKIHWEKTLKCRALIYLHASKVEN